MRARLTARDRKYQREQKQKQRARAAFTRRVRRMQQAVDQLASEYLDDKYSKMLLSADRKFGDAISKARIYMYEAARYTPR